MWAPDHMRKERKKIVNAEIYPFPPFYVRPLGLKQCRNSKTKYHAYDLVVPSWIEDDLENLSINDSEAPRVIPVPGSRVQKKKKKKK